MRKLRAMTSPIGLAAVLLLASATAHATLVKWTLQGVEFSEYGPEAPHPIVTGSFNPTGWLIVDTQSRQITDWKIQLNIDPFPFADSLQIFARGYIAFPNAPCDDGCNTASWAISDSHPTEVQIGSLQLQGAQSFEFTGFCGGGCEQTFSLVALTNLPDVSVFFDEQGGSLRLASGVYDLPVHLMGEQLAGFLTAGSLIGTVVPEPTTYQYFGFALAAWVVISLVRRLRH